MERIYEQVYLLFISLASAGLEMEIEAPVHTVPATAVIEYMAK